MPPGLIPLFITFAVVVLFGSFFLYFVPVGLWITAVFSGVRVGLGTMIGMRLRKVPPGDICARSSAPRRPALISMSTR